MPREPLRVTDRLLAAYRSGVLVAVALGQVSRQPGRRPRGYALHPRRASAAASPAYLAAARTSAIGAYPASGAPPARSQVAVVEVRGVLEQRASIWDCTGETDGYDAIEARFARAANDPATGAIVLDVDSVGGDHHGSEQSFARMSALAIARGLPVLGYANEWATSAAYWLVAAVCRNGIYAPRSGVVGSIASCIPYVGDAGALAKEGHEVYVARGLPGKMRPSGIEPLDDVAIARLDARAAEATAQFIASIAAHRKLDEQVIRGWNADTFTGANAVAAGLLDGLGSLEETIALAASLAALKEAA